MSTCTVVSPECTAPAGWSIGSGIGTNKWFKATAKCYACGLPVCLECSRLVNYYGRRCRLGLDCITDYAKAS